MSRMAVVALILGLAGCVGSGARTDVVVDASYRGWLPAYRGPANEAASTLPDVQPDVRRAYQGLTAAFEAARAQDSRLLHRHLADAVARLTDALQTNPHSRDAAVALGTLYFYQGYYGDRVGYGKCTTFLTRVLEVDPYADQAARYLAHAYDHLGDAEAAVYYANYVASVSTDPELVREMEALRQPYQEAFLSSWYEYGAYYGSPQARITEFNPNTFQTVTVLEVSPAFEQQLAAQGFQQLTPTLQLVQDEEVRRYVQGLVDKLVARSPVGPPLTYRVDVAQSDEVNAMALPGRIVVYTGLIRFAENEAELVAVLGHELAHVYAHHAARQFVSSYRNRRTAEALLSVIDVKDDLKEQMLVLGAEVGLELIRRGYSRQQEREADRYGAHIVFNAGYNPTFMASFFIRLYEANPRHPIRLLATHPPTSDRIEYISQYLENFPLDVEMQIDSRTFQDIKQRLP